MSRGWPVVQRQVDFSSRVSRTISPSGFASQCRLKINIILLSFRVATASLILELCANFSSAAKAFIGGGSLELDQDDSV